MTKQKIDRLVFFFFLLFLFSPATSVTGLLGLKYFPNEKLSFLIALFSVLNDTRKIEKELIGLSLLMASFFLVITVFHSLDRVPIIHDLNLVYLFLAIPIYVSYFRSQKSNISSVLPFIVFLELIFSLFQQINTISNPEWINYLNNYPAQQYYSYPTNEMGLFRTSGLFNESSQYAGFLVTYVVIFFEDRLKRNFFKLVVLLLALADIFISQSITAFLMLGFYCLYLILRNFSFRSTKWVIAVLAFAITSYWVTDVFFTKLTITFNADNSDYPRLINAFKNFRDMFNSAPFSGVGLSWDKPSWDFLSIFFSGYGFLGGFASLFFVILVMSKLVMSLRIIWPSYLLTNGHLLLSLNIFYILYALSTTPSKFNSDKV